MNRKSSSFTIVKGGGHANKGPDIAERAGDVAMARKSIRKAVVQPGGGLGGGRGWPGLGP